MRDIFHIYKYLQHKYRVLYVELLDQNLLEEEQACHPSYCPFSCYLFKKFDFLLKYN